MKITTKIFGEIDIAEDKIITFVNGIIGFPDLKKFTLIYNEEKGTGAGIRWMQSMDEPNFAIPVMDPLVAMDTYNPVVDDEIFKGIGELTQDNTLVLVSATIPKDITQMSVIISSLAFTIVVISSANDTSAKSASVYSTSDPNCPNTWLANLAAK